MYGSPNGSDDLSHLKTLAICHWVGAGLIGLISCMFIIHIVMGIAALNGTFPAGPQPSGQPFPDKLFGWMFISIGSAFLILGWALAGLTLYSGFKIHKLEKRLLSMIVAGILCAFMPIGTVLGVFTLIVLNRASVKSLYDQKAAESK